MILSNARTLANKPKQLEPAKLVGILTGNVNRVIRNASSADALTIKNRYQRFGRFRILNGLVSVDIAPESVHQDREAAVGSEERRNSHLTTRRLIKT